MDDELVAHNTRGCCVVESRTLAPVVAALARHREFTFSRRRVQRSLAEDSQECEAKKKGPVLFESAGTVTEILPLWWL